MKVKSIGEINTTKIAAFRSDIDPCAEREKRILAIVHEIRSPVMALKLTCELIKRVIEKEHVDNISVQSYMTIISENITTIEDRLREVLYLESRETVFEPVDICECLDAAVCKAKDRIFLSGVELRNYTPGDLWVQGDREKLVLAFFNIIINAIEAIKTDKGRIWISAYKVNNSIRVVFKDNGSGMQPEIAERMFDAFFTTKNGFGIGLNTVKDVLKIHNAHIVADSLPDIGTSISILMDSIKPEEIETEKNRIKVEEEIIRNH
jgi:signal transduction histidine kinase